MEKLKMKVNFGIELNHPLNQDFFKADFFLTGEITDMQKVLLASFKYTKISIDFDGWQYMKSAHLLQPNRLSEKAINIDEDYLNKVFEMAELDCKLLKAEFEDVDEYKALKEKMRYIVKTINKPVEQK
jgi:hypothetical protein